jgi:hypothetical protein
MTFSGNGYIKFSVYILQFNDLHFTQLTTVLSKVLDRQVLIQTENIPRKILTI